MTDAVPQNKTVKLARTACFPCRRGKRRCDRALPSCGLCIRRETDCSYPARQKPNHLQFASEDSGSLTPWSFSPEFYPHGNDREVTSISSLTALSKDTQYMVNAVYFIAPQLHLQAQLGLPRPNLPIPSNLASLIGEPSSIRTIASFFFATIHPWLPIVSKQVFYTCLLNPLADRRMELSLLTLSMKLCCTPPSDDEGERAVKTSLYHSVKRFHYDLESAGYMSIHVLQAGLLIALYEMGQAIYPAAYLTVGACARYGLALGINKFALASTDDDYGTLSWNDIEERRRVWWAVLVFDRFSSLSNPARPLSTDDPAFDSYLPVDDTAWDDCAGKPGDAALISTGFTLKMGPFARLAQGTFLLSQALQLIRPAPTKNEPIAPHKLAQLRRTLLALVHAADAEANVRKLEFCAQSGLSLSTILLLQDRHNCINADNRRKKVSLDDLWEETRAALGRLSAAAASHYTTCPYDTHASDSLPIFMIHVMFQAASVLLQLAPEMLKPELRKDVDIFRSVLQLTNLRWRLAGIYLNILDSREVAISGAFSEQGPIFV